MFALQTLKNLKPFKSELKEYEELKSILFVGGDLEDRAESFKTKLVNEKTSDKEKKQISFISKNDIKYENYGYSLIDINSNYTGDKNIQFNNTIEIEKVNMPLPAGIIRAYKKDSSGQDNFVGESRIQNTPKNEKIKIEIGKLFDITGTQKILKFNQRHNIQEVMLETTIKNNGNNTQRLVFDIVSNRYASIKNYNDSCAIKNKKCIVSDQNTWTKRFEMTLNVGETHKFISEYEIHN